MLLMIMINVNHDFHGFQYYGSVLICIHFFDSCAESISHAMRRIWLHESRVGHSLRSRHAYDLTIPVNSVI